jgi:hypothetical protein
LSVCSFFLALLILKKHIRNDLNSFVLLRFLQSNSQVSKFQISFRGKYIPTIQDVALVSIPYLLCIYDIRFQLRAGQTLIINVCRYQMKLAARPVLTQSVTSAVLFATGDAMAQQLVEKKGIQGHELARTGRMAFYGGCKCRAVHAPCKCHS